MYKLPKPRRGRVILFIGRGTVSGGSWSMEWTGNWDHAKPRNQSYQKLTGDQKKRKTAQILSRINLQRRYTAPITQKQRKLFREKYTQYTATYIWKKAKQFHLPALASPEWPRTHCLSSLEILDSNKRCRCLNKDILNSRFLNVFFW